MARNAAGLFAPLSLAFSVAYAASSPAFFGYVRVLFVVFMSVLAVCKSRLSLYLSSAYSSFVLVGHFVSSMLCGYDLIVRKPPFHPGYDAVSLDACDLCKLNGKILGTINNNLSGNSLVALLCFPRGPATVIGRVISVIVDSVNRHAFRWLAHIANKASKAVHPAITNLYSASTVVFILPTTWIQTASFHALPGVIASRNFLKWHKVSPNASGELYQHMRRDARGIVK